MSKRPVKSVPSPRRRGRRSFPEEFKRDAVQMLLDGHTAQSVVERLGLSSANLGAPDNRQPTPPGLQSQPAVGNA